MCSLGVFQQTEKVFFFSQLQGEGWKLSKGGGWGVVPVRCLKRFNCWQRLTWCQLQISQAGNTKGETQIEGLFKLLWTYCAQKRSSLWKPVNLQVACTFVEKVPGISEEIRMSGNDSQSNDFAWWVTDTNRCWLVVSFPCLSFKVHKLFCQPRQRWATLGQPCFECNPAWSSAAIVFLDFELVCFLGINTFIKPLSALLKKTKNLQKIIYSTSHGHFPMIIRIILGIFKEGKKSTHIIIRKSSHICFTWCIHTERHL